jgi:dipeptidyl aminopeptidase/acylaminoacyl peptidase
MRNEKPDESQMETAISLPKKKTQYMKWIKRAGLIALGAACSFTLAVSAASVPLSNLLVRPRLKRLLHLRRPHLRNFLRRLGIKFEEVIIASFDGLKLHGWWFEASAQAPTIVVVHGVKKNRTDVVRASITLRLAGFNVLVYDGRGHGNSEGRYITYGFYERRDLESVLEWLVSEKQVDRNRIGLAGESMGAAIILQVAAQNPWIGAVWADSPFASLRRVTREYVSRYTKLPDSMLTPVLGPAFHVANYRGKFNIDEVDPLRLAAQIKSPVYLVHGTADQTIPVSHSQVIHDALGCKKDLWIVEGARHAKSVKHKPSKNEYAARLVNFFREHLGQ